MKNRMLIGSSALLALVGCVSAPGGRPLDLAKPVTSASQQQRHDYLVGTWLEESVNSEGEVQRELAQHGADGRCQETFRIYHKDGSYDDDVEVCEWGISGNIYFTLTKGWLRDGEFAPADPSDPNFSDAYVITELTPTLFKYRHVETQSEFTDHKVADDYVLPEKP